MKKNDRARYSDDWDMLGTIQADHDGSEKIEILWDGHKASSFVPFNELVIVPPGTVEAIAEATQAKIDAAVSAFEVAFSALADVRESEINHYDLERMKLIDTSKLERTMESGGWNASSLWC